MCQLLSSITMDLWTPILPAGQLHRHFVALLNPQRAAERRLMQQWADGMPDRDGKLIQEFQSTFNSTFWELYLHAVFREYQFSLDWSHPAPDYQVFTPYGSFCVEAVTANSAQGKAQEWEKGAHDYVRDPGTRQFGALNKEGMVRISNALLRKLRAFRAKYSSHDHVKGKPFVVALAPFEQPNFQHQYDRPIRAVLYDQYVDEDAFFRDPSKYPDGHPPTVNLGFVEKENGSQIPLGVFNDDQWQEVSAVLFSCTATMGKVDMLCTDSSLHALGMSVWGGKPNGAAYERTGTRQEIGETLTDGLQVYHNPYARYPLDPRVFRRPGVVQHYYCHDREDWFFEELDNCLQIRGAVLCSPKPFPAHFSRMNVLRAGSSANP
ncbi:MAG: hypothetical protein CVU22_14900 [Betaproteobacteria bacterium HGW-Betaproteobacteria-16]|nr:MAG: hypothetical protein CVU22_14900 [Betaproteobacteria bacterium HGW-Betaproteobacteria-16]